ncbi:cell division protein SepF [Candidatus Woesearchaeota archaeon]|nr:cell division protein SepF [Candidatus Woesearchaeota archaeon]MBW3016803.1 cell division protein SepF [Candidatus Woesearchaeota archaeon]
MKETFINIKNQLAKTFSKKQNPEQEADYVELSNESGVRPGSNAKVVVRPFVMEDFEDIKPVLNSLREGSTIALINIKPLKDKDLVELKRAINKLKKTCDAISGDIAGFGEDYIVATPEFAGIFRNKESREVESSQSVDSQENLETY